VAEGFVSSNENAKNKSVIFPEWVKKRHPHRKAPLAREVTVKITGSFPAPRYLEYYLHVRQNQPELPYFLPCTST
jgi:hypothetical protein